MTTKISCPFQAPKMKELECKVFYWTFTKIALKYFQKSYQKVCAFWQSFPPTEQENEESPMATQAVLDVTLPCSEDHITVLQ